MTVIEENALFAIERQRLFFEVKKPFADYGKFGATVSILYINPSRDINRLLCYSPAVLYTSLLITMYP